MAYGIMRIEKVKRTSAGNEDTAILKRARHNCREYAPEEAPENIHQERSQLNTYEGAKTVTEIQNKIKQLRSTITKHRKDEVGLLEVMITMSGENDLPEERREAFLKTAKKWVEGLYGAENVVGVYFHRDETVPHLHAFLVPLETKEVMRRRTKQEKADGVFRTETRTALNAHKITGGFNRLRALQDDFWEKVSKPFGLERGAPSEETMAKHRPPSLAEGRRQLRKDRDLLDSRELKNKEFAQTVNARAKEVNDWIYSLDAYEEQIAELGYTADNLKANFKRVALLHPDMRDTEIFRKLLDILPVQEKEKAVRSLLSQKAADPEKFKLLLAGWKAENETAVKAAKTRRCGHSR
jgi:hypothetical protein